MDITTSKPTDFAIKPRWFATTYTIFVALLIIAIAPFIYGFSQHYPSPWALRPFLLLFSWILIEIVVTLLKPIAFSFKNGQITAKYLLSSYTFSPDDIAGYSTLWYNTREGVKNGVVLYIKNRRTIEFNEILMQDSLVIKNLLDQYAITCYGADSRFWFSNIPQRKYKTNIT